MAINSGFFFHNSSFSIAVLSLQKCSLSCVSLLLCFAIQLLSFLQWALGQFSGCVVAFLQQGCCPVLEEGGRERGLQVSGRRSPLYGSATELQMGERQKIIRVRQLP